MSKITDLSFIENGANGEQKFAKMVDEYLADQESINKTLDDGTQIFIRKQNLGERGAARYINMNDGVVGWEFVLYPIANPYQDKELAGLKVSTIDLNLGEYTFTLDSKDLDKLEAFLAENM